MATHQKVSEVLVEIATAFGKSIDKATINYYYRLLADINDDILSQAFDDAVKKQENYKIIPAPGTILVCAHDITKKKSQFHRADSEFVAKHKRFYQ